MNPKKVKCLKCYQEMDTTVTRNGKCSCGQVVIVEGCVAGQVYKDYTSLDPQLLCEQI